MIYTEPDEYKVKFYTDPKTGGSPVLEYIDKLPAREEAKILKYVEFLRIREGKLEPPFSKHVKDKIWELRIDLAKNRFRILYFIFIKKTIILLHVFLKRTQKTPKFEIKIAENNYYIVINNQKIYE